jgi:hypothetical protein
MSANNLTDPDESSLASQIMGLKKVAAANRVTGTKSVNKTAKKGNGGDKGLETQVIIQGDNHQNMMVSRSSSHGRLPSSQQPR